MEKTGLLYKALFACLLLAVVTGTGFFVQKSVAEQKQEFLWALAKTDMVYGGSIMARIDVPRLNRYVLVSGASAPHGGAGRYAVWHGAINGAKATAPEEAGDDRLITGTSKGPFSFLRHLRKNDVLVFQIAENGKKERYIVTDFVMSEVPRVKIPESKEILPKGSTLLLATKYDYRNEMEGEQLYLVVIARHMDDMA